MNRKIEWKSYCYDEIELVYEKAEANENIASLLSELEEMAQREVEQNYGMISINGQSLTKEKFFDMSDTNKEKIMCLLSQVGLEEFNPSMTEPVIKVILSPHIQKVLGCTMFSILNRLEKLDGAYNEMKFKKATLEIFVPLGGQKGLGKCEMLIMMMYPWLSVSEKSTDIISATVPT